LSVRSSTHRTILWALALVVALSFVVLSFVQTDEGADDGDHPVSPSPGVPDDPGRGCGEQAVTDVSDLSIDRTLARCGPGSPAAEPLARPVTVRVALAERSESAAPLLVADALGELADENLEVEIVEIDQREAYRAMADGEVDVVVGGIDAPFFDAVHEGVDARLVLGGPVARQPGDVTMAQPGLWLRDDLISDDDEWDNVEGQTVLVAGGPGSAALYPIDLTLAQNSLGANAVDVTHASSESAAGRLLNADVGGAWLTEPAASRLADEDAVRLVATVPGSEAIEGTILAPRLVGDDREVGLAYVRAVVRTINTHLADGYEDEALAALAEALDVSEDDVAAGPAPLFDWEVRAGTTTRIQEALIEVGAVRYERPADEAGLVDRTLAAEVVGGDTGAG
jgi:NitT/TauT family transport system substrate-binding protein